MSQDSSRVKIYLILEQPTSQSSKCRCVCKKTRNIFYYGLDIASKKFKIVEYQLYDGKINSSKRAVENGIY